jgi:aminopeptidase I
VGKAFKPGNGVAMIAGHIDALTARIKPTSTKPNNNGYVQLGVAQYAGALNETWWDRDLSIVWPPSALEAPLKLIICDFRVVE